VSVKKVLWSSQHQPLPSQRRALHQLLGDVQIDHYQLAFYDAKELLRRYREGGYDDLVVDASVSFVERVLQLGIRPIWPEMVEAPRLRAEVKHTTKGYNFARFWRWARLDRVLVDVTATPEQATEFGDVAQRALQVACACHPAAAPQRHAAFANAVADAVTGLSGGYGGPSVRELAARVVIAGARLDFVAAVTRLIGDDGPIFGPLTDVHRQVWDERECRDEDPQRRRGADVLVATRRGVSVSLCATESPDRPSRRRARGHQGPRAGLK
jgi:hypothetical protein